MPITIPQTQTVLLSYFQTGDEPTANQFAELIGTMFYLYQEMLNASAQTQTLATATQALVNGSLPRAYLSAKIASVGAGNIVVWTLNKSLNIASVSGANFTENATYVTFNNPFPDTNYNVIAFWTGPQIGGVGVSPQLLAADVLVTKEAGLFALRPGNYDNYYVAGSELVVMVL